jgi:hypothetical protein
LLLLGLVGPALLLLIMMVVYWQAFGRAVAQAERMVIDQTYRSNQFAAKFLAKSFEAELSNYFAYAERAAQQPDLRDAMRSAADTPLLAQAERPPRHRGGAGGGAEPVHRRSRPPHADRLPGSSAGTAEPDGRRRRRRL